MANLLWLITYESLFMSGSLWIKQLISSIYNISQKLNLRMWGFEN